eukprot:737670-Pleurochrysis_carterae.AAC.2
MFIVASLHYRSGRLLMYGWVIPYKWGHPVATLRVTNGTIRHTRRMTEILRIIITPSPGTNLICRVLIRLTHRGTARTLAPGVATTVGTKSDRGLLRCR